MLKLHQLSVILGSLKDITDSYKKTDSTNDELVLIIIVSIIVIILLALTFRYLYLKQTRFRRKNPELFNILKSLKLKNNEIRILEAINKSLKLKNPLLLLTCESHWATYIATLPDSNRKRAAISLHKKIFTE